MPYSELANWDGSLFDSPAELNSISTQREPSITADRCAGSERGDEVKGAADQGECHDGGSTFEQSVKDSVSKAMAGWTQRRANARRSDEDDMLDQIVVTSRKPSNPEVKSNAPAVEQDTDSSMRGKPGSLSAAVKTHAHVKPGSVQRTYVGPRRIKGVSDSSELKKDLSSRPLFDGSLASALIPYPEDGVASDQDSSVDLLLLEGVSSRTGTHRDESNSVSLDTSSHTRPVDGASQSTLSVSQCKNLTSPSSRNSFQTSPSSIINDERQQTLEKAGCREKHTSKESSIEPQSSPVLRQPAPVHRNLFDCVLIMPRPFQVPRELYKTLEEHAEIEEEGRAAHQEKRKQKEQTNRKGYGKREPIKRTPRQKPAMAEAIYVSSSSEAAVAGPSKPGLSTRRSGFDDRLENDLENVAMSRADSSSDDEFLPSARAPRRKPSARPKVSSKPKTLPKQTGKVQGEETILASESSSESEAGQPVTRLAQKSTKQRRLLPSDLPQTPSTILITPEQAPEQIRVGATVDRAIEPNLEEGGDGSSMEDKAKPAVVSSSPHEHSFVASSISHQETLAATSTLPEKFVKAKAPAEHNNHHAMQRVSPTLCLSGTLTRLTSLTPSSRSTTLAIQDEPSGLGLSVSGGEMKIKKGEVERNEKVEAKQREAARSLLDEESDSDEEDDVCHHCRTRNVYAKMKCTNVKPSRVCPLHFCHRCIVVFFPKVDFDPYSGTFVCPACEGTCLCKPCCRRQGIPDQPKPRGRRWDQLGVTLLLSPQETRRQERQKMAKAAGRSGLSQEVGNKRAAVYRRSCGANAAKAKRVTSIGLEADNWIQQQNTALNKIGKVATRLFVGAWQDAWGPAPPALHAIESVSFDVHAAAGMGKGKGKAVDTGGRLFIGDAQALRRPFLRADDVLLHAEPSPKKRPVKRRKPASADVGHESIYVTSQAPKRKKRRLGNPSTIPEFTMNHHDSAHPSAVSALHHRTPDDFSIPGPESNALNADARTQLRYYDVSNDPMLGVVDHGPSSDGLGGDIYGSEWDSIEMKPYAPATFSEPGFSYQETYDSYAAALGVAAGLEQYDSALSYGYGYSDAVLITSPRISKFDSQVTNASAVQDPMLSVKDSDADAKEDDDFIRLVDPALLGQGNVTKTAEQDPTQFLTAHACASALMSVPMIYGVPSSTGLSLQDLERTVKDSLTALST